MNVIWLKIGCLAAGCLLLAGCDARESLKGSFKSAPFSTRQQIEEAIRLDRANSYMPAAQYYDMVLHGELTSQQRTSIQTAIDNLFTRMCKAAAQGDSEAKQTLEAIEANRRAGR